jgi:hypothetical protein
MLMLVLILNSNLHPAVTYHVNVAGNVHHIATVLLDSFIIYCAAENPCKLKSLASQVASVATGWLLALHRPACMRAGLHMCPT